MFCIFVPNCEYYTMKKIFFLFLFSLISLASISQIIDTIPDTHETENKKTTKEEKKAIRVEHRDSIRLLIREYIAETRPDYNADSVRRLMESGPHFTLFKDNYFIGGTPLGQKLKASNSNVKFQISIGHRLTKSVLPFNTYLFLNYTQKTIWNVMEESMPMRDMNFNPGIGLGHLIVYKNKYVGRAFIMIEHESNGKDSLASRSWNKVSFTTSIMLSKRLNVQMKYWVPIIDSENNRDILKYNGIGHIGFDYISSNERIRAGVLSTWRSNSFSFNTQCELSFKIDKRVNQFLFIQYYNGFGENLLDYNKYKSVLRIGFVIKPQSFSIY